MKTLLLIFIVSQLLMGCAGVSHLVIGRQNLYFDGWAAKTDFYIKGEAREYIKEHGLPQGYKWDRLVSPKNPWKKKWILNLYYGNETVIFTDNVYATTRETWDQEKFGLSGTYYPRPVLVDRTSSPYKYLSLEKR